MQKKHLQLTDMECDLLAGERGPSYIETSQINNCTSRCPKSTAWPACRISSISTHDPKQVCGNRRKHFSRTIHDACIHAVKVITPKTDFVTLTLEEFSNKDMRWLEPFQVRLSLQKEKFASGTFLLLMRQMHCQEFRMESMYWKRWRKTKFVTLKSCFIA